MGDVRGQDIGDPLNGRGASRLRVLLELARVANLPTVWSNVLVGVVAATSLRGSEAGAQAGHVGDVDLAALAVVVTGVTLLYVAGMVLNDACDASRDAERRPTRPIPSGRISRRTATGLGIALLVAGVGLLATRGAPALVAAGVLAASIVLYDVLHTRFPAAVVLMGLCRGAVYVVAALGVGPAPPPAATLVFGGAMMLFILVLTAIARREHERDRGVSPLAGVVLAATVLWPATLVGPRAWWPALLAGILLTWWLLRSTLVPRSTAAAATLPIVIMGWLAGICLADAYFLLLMDAPAAALICVGLFAITHLGHRRLPGS